MFSGWSYSIDNETQYNYSNVIDPHWQHSNHIHNSDHSLKVIMLTHDDVWMKTSEFKEVYSGVPQGSVLGPLLFLLFINDVSNFTTGGCFSNMYADDVIICTSAATSDDLRLKLQRCVDNIYQWYFRNKLTINKKKSAVMIIGSKIQLQSLNLDQFSINLESNKIELVNNAKYLGLLVQDDLSWDEHILQRCKNMNYYLHVLRRLNTIFPKQLLLKVYKSYIQSSKLDYGLSIWGCTTEGNLDRVQRIQIFGARIICNNYDYVNTRCIDLVKSFKLQAIRERRDYFLCVLMFKCIYTWPCTSLLVQWCYYGRRHPWLRDKEFRKYGSIRTKMYKRTV